MFNFTLSERCFVAGQICRKFTHFPSVKFPGLKMCECKKNDKYQVWWKYLLQKASSNMLGDRLWRLQWRLPQVGVRTFIKVYSTSPDFLSDWYTDHIQDCRLQCVQQHLQDHWLALKDLSPLCGLKTRGGRLLTILCVWSQPWWPADDLNNNID